MIESRCLQLNVFLKIAKGSILRFPPALRLSFLTTNRSSLRIDCSQCCVIKSCSYFCCVHVQTSSQWRNGAVGWPRTLHLFINWVTCLTSLKTPGLLNPVDEAKSLREVMAAHILCKCKHLCMLNFRAVANLSKMAPMAKFECAPILIIKILDVSAIFAKDKP